MDLLIFDLDGTLIDSQLDLAHSVNATRDFMGMPPLSHELIATYVGNGAPVLIRRAMGPEASEDDVQRALDYFLDYYRKHMLDHTRLYPGVRKSLDRLREHGVKMAVLTNKPVRISKDILNGLGVGTHFFQVYGGNSFEHKKPHPIGVEMLLEESGVDRQLAMMVGDSAVDVRTARNAGILCCGVTYGFQPEGFEEEPPDLLVNRMEELADLVLDRRQSRLDAAGPSPR
ncbi:MAG: HAD-IA family hydrolase [Bryobacteraceae bacterium]|jgi:2-phosphoglycolate phosphatase, prokaryotic|nr:HAD-IA family hydrolase [Bryobacteraceae bacterium]